jgi:hypothetical protein
VIFRWGADKQLRDALCDFAADTRHVHPWAAHPYDQARTRGHNHPHTVRILAAHGPSSSGAADKITSRTRPCGSPC